MATSKFGRAFAAARKAGKKTFTWNGKKYTTEVRKPVSQKLKGKTVPKPTPRPGSKPAAKKDIGAKKPTGKTPTPTPAPERVGGKKANGTPIPKMDPRKAPASGIARKGSRLAIAAQRQREKPVKRVSSKPASSPKIVMDRSANRKDPMQKATQSMQRRQEMEKATRTGNRQPKPADKKKRKGILSILGF